jgi:hypothetical protein
MKRMRFWEEEAEEEAAEEEEHVCEAGPVLMLPFLPLFFVFPFLRGIV